MTITVSLTKTQTSAVIHAIATCLHLAEKSPNIAHAYGIDLIQLQRLNTALERFEKAIPEPVKELATETHG